MSPKLRERRERNWTEEPIWKNPLHRRISVGALESLSPPKRDWSPSTEATFLRSPPQTRARWRGEWGGGASCLIAQCWHKPSREWAPNRFLDVFQEARGHFPGVTEGSQSRAIEDELWTGGGGEGEGSISRSIGPFPPEETEETLPGRRILDFSLQLKFLSRKFIFFFCFWWGKNLAYYLWESRNRSTLIKRNRLTFWCNIEIFFS